VTDARDIAAASDSASSPSAPEQPASPLLEMLPHILRTLQREPALAITLIYAFVAMAGIFYNFSFYRRFDIPVLTLSQIGDFLVAGIQQPMALVLVASTFPLCWLFDRINMRGRRRRAATRARLRALPSLTRIERARLGFLTWMQGHGRGWYSQFSYVLIVLAYSWTFVAIYADYRADVVKHGEAPLVRVWMNGSTDSLATAGEAPWTYLGAIGQYVFVYDHEAARAAILPVNAIARIEPVAGPPREPGVVVAPIP
jgi:hypothetical protein